MIYKITKIFKDVKFVSAKDEEEAIKKLYDFEDSASKSPAIEDVKVERVFNENEYILLPTVTYKKRWWEFWK